MRIAVLFGGKSEERDVSVASGAQIVRALESLRHDVVAVDTERGVLPVAERARLLSAGVDATEPSGEALAQLRHGPSSIVALASDLAGVDVVFVALHGGSGEDGSVQAVLDLARVPYTGSGHLASAFAMDKDVSKRLFRASNIPTPDWVMTPVHADVVTASLGLPVVVKPNKQGSTVGLTIVREPRNLEPAITTAARYDDEVMVDALWRGVS